MYLAQLYLGTPGSAPRYPALPSPPPPSSLPDQAERRLACVRHYPATKPNHFIFRIGGVFKN